MPTYVDVSGASWIGPDDVGLHQRQLDAINHVGNLVVAAGPGTGKTEFMAHLAMHRLQTGRIAPHQKILALTYKRDAARNLRERVTERIPELADRFECLTLDAFTKGLVDRFRLALPAAWTIDNYRLVLRGDPVTTWGKDTFDRHAAATQAQWAGVLRGDAARASLPMLCRLAAIVLEDNPRIRRSLHSTFGLVMIDEAQDTTSAHVDFLKSCFDGFRGQIVAVGDPNQRIMGFAGAHADAIGAMQAVFDAQVLPLNRNYRSRERLVRFQAEVLSILDLQDATLPDLADTDEGGGLWRAHFANEVAEATMVADIVHGWLAEGTSPNEVAVLLTRKDNIARLVAAIQARGHPARNEGPYLDLNADPLVQLTLDSIRLATGKDTEAWIRLVRLITDLSSMSPSSRDAQPVREATTIVAQVRQLLPDLGSPDWTQAIIQRCYRLVGAERFGSFYPAYKDPSWLQETVSQFVALFEAPETAAGIAAALDKFAGKGTVPVLTIYKAKGLEYRDVCLVGAEDGEFWGESGPQTMFVGISRASDRLVVTSVDRRNGQRTQRNRLAAFHQLLNEYPAI